MAIDKISKVYKESGARIEITRVGQQPEKEGDGFIAQLAVHLPTKAGESTIKKELHFGNRLKFCGYELYLLWGEVEDGGRSQYKHYLFIGDTWAKAFENAEKYAESEIKKLHDALSARALALANAEND